jgi:hypothetical protein
MTRSQTRKGGHPTSDRRRIVPASPAMKPTTTSTQKAASVGRVTQSLY